MKQIPNDIFFAQVISEINAGRSVIIKVKGTSMLPFIRNGKDAVKLDPVNQQLVQKDVVLFNYNGNYILHRIVKIEGNRYLIQGDGIYSSCESCNREDIVGKVSEIHRLKGNEKYKIYPTDEWPWRLYSTCWLFFRPLRRYLLYIIKKAQLA